MHARTLELSAGPIQVRDSGGDGEPVLLVHGLFVDGRLWDAVARCSRPPGCESSSPTCRSARTRRAMRPDAPLAPPDVARLLGEIAEALGLTA